MPGRADGGIAVVIPAYQAAATIGGVVTGVRHALPGVPVYVVDDGSGDETGRAGRDQGATVLVHPRNLGKGAALRTGIARALADGAAMIVTLDADGRSEEHTSELQSQSNLVCRLLLEKKSHLQCRVVRNNDRGDQSGGAVHICTPL